MELKIGARVRVKPSEACRYVQPWRGRFEKGRVGTVVMAPSDVLRGWSVIWDHKKVKYPRDYKMVMYEPDIEVVEAAPEDFDPKPLLEAH